MMNRREGESFFYSSFSIHHSSFSEGSVDAQGLEGFRPRVVQGPQGVEGGHVEQLAGARRCPRDDHLAAVLLDALVTAEQKGQEDRADVVDLAEVENEAGRWIGAERRQYHQRR